MNKFKFTCQKARSQIQRPLEMTSSSKIIENKMSCFKSVELYTGYEKGWDRLFMEKCQHLNDSLYAYK